MLANLAPWPSVDGGRAERTPVGTVARTARRTAHPLGTCPTRYLPLGIQLRDIATVFMYWYSLTWRCEETTYVTTKTGQHVPTVSQKSCLCSGVGEFSVKLPTSVCVQHLCSSGVCRQGVLKQSLTCGLGCMRRLAGVLVDAPETQPPPPTPPKETDPHSLQLGVHGVGGVRFLRQVPSGLAPLLRCRRMTNLNQCQCTYHVTLEPGFREGEGRVGFVAPSPPACNLK